MTEPESAPKTVRDEVVSIPDRGRPSLLQRFRHELLILYVFAVFWAYGYALDIADFFYGPLRASLIVLGIVGVWLLPRARLRRTRGISVLLVIAAILIISLRFSSGLDAVYDGRAPAIDVGQTTITAVNVWRQGGEPYRDLVDPGARSSVDPDGVEFRFFGGFKYGPVMIWAYAPLVLAHGPPGYFATSLLALAVLALAVYAWARHEGGELAGLGGMVLALIPGFVAFELFVQGVNDVVAVALAISSFAILARGHALASGVLMGLSLAAKALPALILLLPALLAARSKPRFVVGAAVFGLGCHLPFLIQSPKELWANLVVFNVIRPVSTTSLVYELPFPFDVALQVISYASVVVGPILFRRKLGAGTPSQVAAIVAAIVGVFLVGGKLLHRNFLLWLIPFLAVSIATRLWSAPDRADAMSDFRRTESAPPP